MKKLLVLMLMVIFSVACYAQSWNPSKQNAQNGKTYIIVINADSIIDVASKLAEVSESISYMYNNGHKFHWFEEDTCIIGYNMNNNIYRKRYFLEKFLDEKGYSKYDFLNVYRHGKEPSVDYEYFSYFKRYKDNTIDLTYTRVYPFGEYSYDYYMK